MFGKRQQQFVDAVEVLRRLTRSEDVPELKRVFSLAHDAWLGAGRPDGPRYEVLCAFEARIDELDRQRHVEWLQPCSNCTGKTYRISSERHVDDLGKVRYVVCVSCGLLRTFWSRIDELGATPFFGSPVTVEAAPGGPFR